MFENLIGIGFLKEIEILRVVEFLTGLFYLIFGLDGFLNNCSCRAAFGTPFIMKTIRGFHNKIPKPEPSVAAKDFLQALDKAKFLLPSVKLLEIFVGVCFIFSYKGPLAWCLLSPIVFVILGYHFFINKKEFLMPIVILAAQLILFYKYVAVLSLLWL